VDPFGLDLEQRELPALNVFPVPVGGLCEVSQVPFGQVAALDGAAGRDQELLPHTPAVPVTCEVGRAVVEVFLPLPDAGQCEPASVW